MKKSLTEKIANMMENNRKDEADDLRERGIGRYLTTKVITDPIMAVAGVSIAVTFAALTGEVMDHVPYISTVIPEALNGLTNSEYFSGNLDKFAALLGFTGYFLKKEL